MSWRQWAIGEVVLASDFQSLVQNQVIQVYADAAARDTALGSAVEAGMFAHLLDTSDTQYYNDTAWVSVSNPGDITEVTAGTALTGGGTSGAVTLGVDLAAITIPTAQISDLTATATEINHTDGVTSNIQTQLDAKQDELTGLTATVAEINFVDGVTSAIQSQIDGKVGRTNGSVTTASTSQNVVRNITLSTADPTGGADGDVWLKYTA
jgi:hypothetical protein